MEARPLVRRDEVDLLGDLFEVFVILALQLIALGE
jgi:hypothetical protein